MSASTAAVGVAGLASRESFAVAPVRSRAVSRDAATPRRRGAAVTPGCMGRKAAKVAAKKQKGEAIRTKLYGKYGTLIVTAVTEGGGADPVANTQLAKVLPTPLVSASPATSSSATSSAPPTPLRRTSWSSPTKRTVRAAWAS